MVAAVATFFVLCPGGGRCVRCVFADVIVLCVCCFDDTKGAQLQIVNKR